VREWVAIVQDRTSPPLTRERPCFDGAGLAEATAGILLRPGRLPIRGGAVDSRRIAPGNAFFALPGEVTDGQRFLRQAAMAGAAALVVRDAPDTAELGELGDDVAVIQVRDAGAALRSAAAAWRDRFEPLVVGVTGSLAKTSTKEQIAETLAERWRVLRNEGNENNEVGLPLTLLRLAPEDEACVLEMGMYVAGDIKLLAAVARPSIGVVTAVRSSHLSRAGSMEAIERGKRELVEALPATGTAVLNADDPRVDAMASHTAARVLRYGFRADADVVAESVESLGEEGMRFTLRLPDGASAAVRTPALGRHSVHNALAAAAVGFAAGMATDEIVRGLARGFRAPHRSVLVRAGEWRILDDSYNAAPDSMAAALDLLATLPGRHVAVLGEMLELGDGSDEAHREVGRLAADLTDRLVVVGAGARGIAEGAAAAGMGAGAFREVGDRDSALAYLLDELRPDDRILVKASRGIELDLLVDALVVAGERAAGAAGAPAKETQATAGGLPSAGPRALERAAGATGAPAKEEA
jgi:UDP-N-acetylmuramoyl-tripeptide--D-alanyl-D-alanine ligase